jgi:hypothetical protein
MSTFNRAHWIASWLCQSSFQIIWCFVVALGECSVLCEGNSGTSGNHFLYWKEMFAAYLNFAASTTVSSLRQSRLKLEENDSASNSMLMLSLYSDRLQTRWPGFDYRDKRFCLLHGVQTSPEAHPASNPMGRCGSFLRGTEAGVRYWKLTSI